MVSFIYNAAAASLLGMLAGMGVGGGSLLLLWLTQVALIETTQARIINLLFFLPAAVIATVFRRKQSTFRLKPVLPAILSGCGAAAVVSILSRNWELDLMRKLLGGLLIITGIREICYRPRKAK